MHEHYILSYPFPLNRLIRLISRLSSLHSVRIHRTDSFLPHLHPIPKVKKGYVLNDPSAPTFMTMASILRSLEQMLRHTKMWISYPYRLIDVLGAAKFLFSSGSRRVRTYFEDEKIFSNSVPSGKYRGMVGRVDGIGSRTYGWTGVGRITLALVVSGQAGGKWHIPFAVINRTGWGIRGAWFPLVNRIILSCCWYGVQAWYGGQMVKVMIGAIWPSFYNLKNTFGDNAAMETNEFISFIIFWTISLPIFMLRPEHYRIPAIVSSAIVTIAAFAIFIWALAKQGDVGPLWKTPEEVYGVGRLTGSQLSWTMMRMITSGIGGWAGGILYQSDFSRYAVHPGDQMWGQIFIIPLCLFGSNLLGIITTSCARGFYPDDPLLCYTDAQWERSRAAVFFAAFAFLLSQMCVNIVACGTVGGMDLAALLPRYLNIRRGSFVVAIVGICINPWRILDTANSFISAISAYAVFLGPLTGIMLAEYYLIRRRRLKLSHLYLPGAKSDYWFSQGINIRAPVVWILTVWPSLPGFSASVTPATVEVSQRWMHVYYMSWLLELFSSAAIWVAWNTLSPPPGVGEVDETDVYGTFGSSSSVVPERAVDRNIGWFGGRKRPAGEVNLDMDRDSVSEHVGKTSQRESLDGRDRIGAGSV
ncbi:hypothetical protein D9757_010126 [Collybiopsis confluens]|uniref:Uncharacterized protein n=1 Tax=Collybiopsis confluens TaxID=2823264 RepID=A0A8H5GT24_9AGAR|nr:hypothetical protein D9757_010126 [Collybiopsis confluens]